MTRRTLTKEEFAQLKALLPGGEGDQIEIVLSQWAPAGFHRIPGDRRVVCTPDTWERFKVTSELLREAKVPARRAAMGR